MQKNNKVTAYLILVIIIVALIIGGIVIATKKGEKQAKDYDKIHEKYSQPNVYEDEMGIYTVTKDELDFDD